MIHSLSNIPGIGRPIKAYSRSKKSIRKVAIVSVISLLISGLVFSGAFAKNGGWDQKIVLSILGLALSLPGIFGFYMLFTRRDSSAVLHENGFVYRYGSKEFGTTWDDIASLTESTASLIEKKNGETFSLGQNLEGFEEIALTIQEETLSRMLPAANASIDRGGTLSFGGLKAKGQMPLGKALPDALVGGGTFTVDSQGITLAESGNRISWPDVVDFGLRMGEGTRARFAFFFISDATNTFEVNYGALPNGHLLLQICGERASHLKKMRPTEP